MGSASKRRKIDDPNLHTDESSVHDKDDVVTNGYNNTNRAHDPHFDNIEQISDSERRA